MSRSDRYRSLSSFYELIELLRIPERRGSLTFIEGGRDVPFDIARVYYLYDVYLYDVPASAMRAGHAHHRLSQLLIAASGSFNVNLDNGFEKATLHLGRPYRDPIGLPKQSVGRQRRAGCLRFARRILRYATLSASIIVLW